jgi:vanillate O-demethylase monooxygenase subunit
MGDAARMLVEYAVLGLMTPFEREDLPMLEAQQRAIGDGDFWSARPIMLSIDGAAIRARRIIERKLAEEARERDYAATLRASADGYRARRDDKTLDEKEERRDVITVYPSGYATQGN